VLEKGKTSYRYEVQYLTAELYDEGQKLGKLYQKFVSVLLEDWISGGRGRVTGLLSSSSISSRTAVQNLTRSWMTSLALASGVGNLDLVTRLSAEADVVRETLQSSRPLSASALTELRRRTPGSSVSNQGPMVSGRQGRYFGACVQVMMSVLVAVQDASKPNGSVNGVDEPGRTAPGTIRLDPIMTVLWRFLGFERHEEVPQPGVRSACSSCGRFLASGRCHCSGTAEKASTRDANVNPAFRASSASLACLGIDVSFAWAQPEPPAEMPAETVKPDDAEWTAVPPHREATTMLDARRREPTERRAEKASCSEKMVEGKRRGLSFGPLPLGRVVADQFVFAMRALKRRAVWDSGDRTHGYTVLAHESLTVFAEAFRTAADDVVRLKRCLVDLRTSEAELPLDSMRDVGGLSLGAEVGGTLQLHTSDERTKEVLIGVVAFANSAKRVFRAFLAEAPALELRPLLNRSYSAQETCNERELRLEFERNVLGYLYLATTLAVLPLRRRFRSSVPTVVRAELRLDTGCSHVSASHIFGEDGERLFFKDAVLGANPLARGWCSASRLPLKFVVYSARVEHYPTAWHEVQSLCESLELGSPSEEVLRGLDGALTSSPPALNGIDQRPVFEAVVRDEEAFRMLDPSVCGYGVLHHADLRIGSGMRCVDCGDCLRYFEGSAKGAAAAVRDIEDTTASASSYFRRVDAGNRRRLFEQGGTGLKARRVHAVPPLRVVPRRDLWAFRCATDEDASYLTSRLPYPEVLEEVPGVAEVLEGMPAADARELAAESAWLQGFWRRRGGPPDWVQKAHAAVQLLIESADELERALRAIEQHLQHLSR
jgi:hypothetical protein